MTVQKKIILVLIPLVIIGVILIIKVNELKSYTLNGANMENTIKAGTKVYGKEGEFALKRFDIITYIDPEFDTIIVPKTFPSYYTHVRMMGHEQVKANFEIKYVPIEENKERWIGRCVGLPGDTIYIYQSDLYVNGELYDHTNIKKTYIIDTDENTSINPKRLEEFSIPREDFQVIQNKVIVTVTIDQLINISTVIDIDTAWCQYKEDEFDSYVFPYNENYKWNQDYFGPVIIPQKGVPINISTSNLPLYSRLISGLEKNNLKVIGDVVYLNGKKCKEYIPKMDYYFIINDNRNNSVDSRMWGLLPESHIVGKIIDF